MKAIDLLVAEDIEENASSAIWEWIVASRNPDDEEDNDQFGLELDLSDELDYYDDDYIETVRTHRCIINPANPLKIIFDHLVILCILYIATFGAFKIAFVKVVESPLWTPARIFVDIVFLLDIILTFFTPRVVENELVKNHWRLAIIYLRFWFWADLVSIIPFEILLE